MGQLCLRLAMNQVVFEGTVEGRPVKAWWSMMELDPDAMGGSTQDEMRNVVLCAVSDGLFKPSLLEVGKSHWDFTMGR